MFSGGKSKVPVPWDIMVFISITTVGFGFSVQRLVTREAEPKEEMHVTRTVASPTPTSGVEWIEIGCLERTTVRRVETEETSVRLRGKLCSPSLISSLRVINTSTGKEGTVFLRDGNRGFLTDQFEVRDGKNVIRLEWRDPSSSASREIVAEVTVR